MRKYDLIEFGIKYMVHSTTELKSLRGYTFFLAHLYNNTQFWRLFNLETVFCFQLLPKTLAKLKYTDIYIKIHRFYRIKITFYFKIKVFTPYQNTFL